MCHTAQTNSELERAPVDREHKTFIGGVLQTPPQSELVSRLNGMGGWGKGRCHEFEGGWWGQCFGRGKGVKLVKTLTF